jgi:hypothetical protein
MDQTNPKKTKKRSHDSDSDSDIEHTTFSTSWAPFLVIQGTDSEKPLNKLSPFAIAKGIQGLAGEPKKVTRLRSGDILVEVCQRSHSVNLLKSTMLVDTPIRVSIHKSLNSKKGVIRCKDLKYCSEEEIVEGLSDQKVTEAKHIQISKDGQRIKTGTVILTFATTVLPQEVRVGFENVRVSVYIPNPLRCFKCQHFGHHKENCRQEAACAKCSKGDHVEKDCAEAALCANCKGNHPSFSKSCPKWLEEKEVQRLKCTLNINFVEARRLFNRTQGPDQGKSYAEAAKKVSQSVSVQTELTWPLNSDKPKKVSVSKPQVASPAQSTKSTQSGSNVQTSKTTVKPTPEKKNEKTDKPVKINRPNRNSKNTEDPIIHVNKFQVLDEGGGEESMVTDVIPPTPKQKQNNKSNKT